MLNSCLRVPRSSLLGDFKTAVCSSPLSLFQSLLSHPFSIPPTNERIHPRPRSPSPISAKQSSFSIQDLNTVKAIPGNKHPTRPGSCAPPVSREVFVPVEPYLHFPFLLRISPFLLALALRVLPTTQVNSKMCL